MSLVPYLDAVFNPLLVEGFLTGIYFLLFVQAISKLFRKRASRPYIFALIVLWMSCTSSFIFDWARAHNAFVVHSDSPTSILQAFAVFSNTSPFVSVMISNVVSDGILIWRCHTLWKSKLILAILIALLMSSTVFNLLVLFLPASRVQTALLSEALGILLAAVTTLFATFMIALRIILVTRESRGYYSYTKVIEILVESAALQSAVLLFTGIINIVTYISPTEPVVLLAANTLFLRRIIVGIAPTLIAFRVADEKPQTEVGTTTGSGPSPHMAFRQFKRGMDTSTVAQRTWVSTIHFDTAQREDDGGSIHSGIGSEDGLSQRESIEKAMHSTPGYDRV
ncbi:hypothetical protein D9619_013677 [Psilocybe cf. subviscida]|uniref:Uncharacterized protein n=1 Tax=Psilocybe cf. subviscida TaxID=2480587 RepID=A0A8H5AZ40_9AGAR|nr:hypothetical protein D9619_013677 [Psilocybe cf. subviscida]